MLNEKLPSELRMVLARRFQDDVWTLPEMMESFRNELYAKERSAAIGMNISRNGMNISRNNHKKFNESTASAFLVNGKQACVYCRVTHPSFEVYEHSSEKKYSEKVCTLFYLFKVRTYKSELRE